jgi:hypothetical protein
MKDELVGKDQIKDIRKHLPHWAKELLEMYEKVEEKQKASRSSLK